MKFLAAALKSLIAELVQIENLIGGFLAVSGVLVVASHGSPAAQWVGLAVSAAGGATVALPKVVAFLRGVEGELPKIQAAVTPKPHATERDRRYPIVQCAVPKQ